MKVLIRPLPYLDESLFSYLSRVAASNFITISNLLSYLSFPSKYKLKNLKTIDNNEIIENIASFLNLERESLTKLTMDEFKNEMIDVVCDIPKV